MLYYTYCLLLRDRVSVSAVSVFAFEESVRWRWFMVFVGIASLHFSSVSRVLVAFHCQDRCTVVDADVVGGSGCSYVSSCGRAHAAHKAVMRIAFVAFIACYALLMYISVIDNTITPRTSIRNQHRAENQPLQSTPLVALYGRPSVLPCLLRPARVGSTAIDSAISAASHSHSLATAAALSRAAALPPRLAASVPFAVGRSAPSARRWRSTWPRDTARSLHAV